MKYACMIICSLLVWGGAFCATARDTFQIYWRGTAYTTNAAGSVSTRRYSEKEIVNRLSANNGLNPATQVLVYVHDEEEPAEELEVVPLSEGARTTSNVYQFLGGGVTSNSTGTATSRLRFIFDEDHSQALGSITGTERLKRRPDGSIATFSYYGTFMLSLPETNTMVVGTFSTGRRIR